MPQLLVIKSETVVDGLQYIGDVVGVFPDDHIFSASQQAKFNILGIGMGINTVNEVNQVLERIKPRIVHAYLWASDNTYHWEMPDGGVSNLLGIIEVYRVEGSSRWYKAENDFLFPVNVSQLTPEEKQLLETVDINHSSVDSFLRKLVKDMTVLSGNDVEIKELRNTEPGV